MSESSDSIVTIGSDFSDGGFLPDDCDSTTFQLSTIEVSTLITYIKEVVSPGLEGRSYVHPSLINLLEDSSSQDKLRRFITDTQVKSILIQRFFRKEADHSSESSDNVTFSITEEANYSHPLIGHILIKKSSVLKEDENIASQLLYMYLDNTNVLERFLPFNAKSDKNGDKMVSSTEIQIVDPEMHLLHYQQNIDIPEINSQVNPTILTVMQKCAEEGRIVTVNDFADKIDDPIFLNQLQNQVHRWIWEMDKVTKLDRDASTGTALQEISFWLNLERALIKIHEKRETPEVALTLDILKKGKRFHATVSFDADTRLKEALAKVKGYNRLLKNFPLNGLLSATDLDEIKSAILLIFQRMRQISDTNYPMNRALNLMEAISKDFMSRLLKVLETRQIMKTPHEEFINLIRACNEILETWDNEFSEMRFLYRNLIGHKRDEIYQRLWKMNFEHHKLQPRLEQIMNFRREHEQFRAAIVQVLSLFKRVDITSDTKTELIDLKKSNSEENADCNIVEEIDLAYESVAVVDPLDISSRGSDSWESTLKRYEERIDRIEARITDELRDLLGIAKNSDEMFQIFSQFNKSSIPVQIRGALREYQTKLIQLVEDEIRLLHDKFQNEVKLVTDVPQFAGIFIRNMQIVKQLEDKMKHLNVALGSEWKNELECQNLKAYADSFYNELNIKTLSEEWDRDVQKRRLNVSDRIFNIEQVGPKSLKGTSLKLSVNFMPELFTLPEEVKHLETSYPRDSCQTLFRFPPSKRMRDLESFEFSVPDEVINKAHQMNQLLPFAKSLIQSIEYYKRTCEKINEKSNLILLAAEMKNDVQTILSRGVFLVWESNELDTYVKGLAHFVQDFHEKVDELLVIIEEIEIEVKNLETCSYSSTVFAEILNRIQKSVDDLSLHRYSNLNQWVNKLNKEIEKRLASRLQAGIKAWTSALVGQEKNGIETIPVRKASDNPKIRTLHHELLIIDQVLYISPSIEEARFNLLQQLFSWQNVILSLNHIQSRSRGTRLSVHQYRTLIKKMTDGHLVIEQAYEAIEDKIQQMKIYVDQWLRYQSFWDLQLGIFYDQLGDDISKWTNTLEEIKKSRSIFDTTETRKEFRPIIIDYAKVQSKVNTKYDSWRNEILSQFQSILKQKYF